VARFACKKHGVTGAIMACGHIAESVSSNGNVKSEPVDLKDLLVPKIHLCKDCVLIWNDLSGSAKDEFLEHLSPVCDKCFNERRVALL
jgi:hypothetical protein